MPSRTHARLTALAATCLACVVPAAIATPSASATPRLAESSGGAGFGGGSGSPSTVPSASAQDVPTGPVSTAGSGISLSTSAVGTTASTLTFDGEAPSGDDGDELAIQRETDAGAWQTVSQTTIGSDGSFSADWTARVSGLVDFRASLGAPAGTAQAASVAPATATPALSVTIYAKSIATLYGPGFYGNKTACGFKLTKAMLGVASRTLKCGTKVSISYDGKSITVPVIDRGPYANNATWDLTMATAAALGDPETETVGAAVL